MNFSESSRAAETMNLSFGANANAHPQSKPNKENNSLINIPLWRFEESRPVALFQDQRL